MRDKGKVEWWQETAWPAKSKTFTLVALDLAEKLADPRSRLLRFSFQTALVLGFPVFSVDDEQVEEESCSAMSLRPVPVPGNSRCSINILFPLDTPLQLSPPPQAGPDTWDPLSPLLLSPYPQPWRWQGLLETPPEAASEEHYSHLQTQKLQSNWMS